MPNIFSLVTGLGMLFVLWGVIIFDLRPALFGMTLVYCGKLWVLNRMVWLWEGMKDANEEYRKWADPAGRTTRTP